MEYLAGILAVSVTTIGSLALIWFLDRFEKEPIWLLALAFLWGAVPAVVVSLVIEMAFRVPLSHVLEKGIAEAVMGTVVAPITEEGVKAFGLLVLFLVLRHHLDDILDGIVFGAVVGAGFAWLEDIFYVLGAAAKGVEAMGIVFVLRVFVFGLNHAFFTALAGLGFGVAKVVRSCWLGVLAVILSFGAAVGAHLLHNALVGMESEAGVVASFAVHWSGLFGLLIVIVGVWFAEWRCIKNELREELALGTVGKRDYGQVSKWFGRLGWELKFLAALDLDGFLRVRKMYNRLVKLAFLKRSWRRRPRERTERRIAELRERIARARC